MRKKQQAEQTRRRILEAALRLFAQRGYASTSMTDLADAVDMTVGVLYWHFEDKEALLLATLAELERRFRTELLSATDGTPPEDLAERARYLIGRVARVVERHQHNMLLIGVISAEATDTNPRIERGLRAAYAQVATIVADMLERGKAAGLCERSTDVACAAQLFLGLYMGGIMHQRLFRSELPLARALPELERMLFAALYPQAGPARRRSPRSRGKRVKHDERS